MGGGSKNSVQGDFGEAWLRVVAAGCGLLHGRPFSLDTVKADIQLMMPGETLGICNPTVFAQVKTTTDLRRLPDGDYAYDLDVPTYDLLRRSDHMIPRVLVVIGSPKDGERIRLRPDGTLLVGQGAWVSLEGYPPSRNRRTQTVRLPAANTLDRAGLERMLKEVGVRRSTPVQDVDPWELP